MTLTKAHIAERLFAKNLFTKGESAQIIETLFELIKQSLQDCDDVLVSGFGKFCVREKHQRRGRNPQTGESLMLAPRKVVTFKCSKFLKEKVNQSKPVRAAEPKELLKLKATRCQSNIGTEGACSYRY